MDINKVAQAAELTTFLFITFLIMDTTFTVIAIAALVLWAVTFCILGYRNLKEAQEIDARTKQLQAHKDRESFVIGQYEKLLEQRNSILASSNEDLKTRVTRMNDEALSKKRGRPAKK